MRASGLDEAIPTFMVTSSAGGYMVETGLARPLGRNVDHPPAARARSPMMA
jgi:hypothetical protein